MKRRWMVTLHAPTGGGIALEDVCAAAPTRALHEAERMARAVLRDAAPEVGWTVTVDDGAGEQEGMPIEPRPVFDG